MMLVFPFPSSPSYPGTVDNANKGRDSGDRMWNAPNDNVNQVQENSISGFSDTPCPYVIRFTA